MKRVIVKFPRKMRGGRVPVSKRGNPRNSLQLTRGTRPAYKHGGRGALIASLVCMQERERERERERDEARGLLSGASLSGTRAGRESGVGMSPASKGA